MPNYIRIINRPFWPTNEEIEKGVDIQDLQARAVAWDLRTKDNDLSIWCVDNPEDAVLAMVLGAQRIEDTFTLKIDESLLENNNLVYKNEQGHTDLRDINQFHYNIKNLTYKSLADVSNVILEALKDENNLESFEQEKIIEIINKALNEGRIKTINQKLKEYIEKCNTRK